MTKGLDKIIVVVAYKNDETKEVGEDTLILNVWNEFLDCNSFRRRLENVVAELATMKNFTSAKICAVIFSETAHLQESIKCISTELAELDGDASARFEDWNHRFFPNGRYIGPLGK